MSDLTTLRRLVWHLIGDETVAPTPGKIREMINKIRPACPEVTDDEAEGLALELEETIGILLKPAPALSRPFEPWLDERKPAVDWYYWKRYRDFLVHRKRFPPQVVAEIDNDTDRIVGFLEDPEKAGPSDRRGMVMGHVQSGKTGNYIGVVTKAADAGYRVIIVIAGTQNRLRNQTQERLDEAFIGYDTGKGLRASGRQQVGVGLYGLQRTPITFTTAASDFNKLAASQIGIRLKDLQKPVVFVIKKETHILKNLIEWLTTHNAHHLRANTISEPMVLIDDEADNASINIKHHIENVSTINRQIRELLSLFERSAYIGYTATPFANILIDPDEDHSVVGEDLFPRHFIVSLNAPSNYFGAEEVLGDQGAQVIQEIDDHQDLLPMSHKIDHAVTRLPDSLRDAVRTFLLAKAIRMVLGQRKVHNSMLVNVSRFTSVQRQIRNEIHAYVDGVAASIRVHGSRPDDEALKDPEIGALWRTFNEQYAEYAEAEGVRWDQVRAQLAKAVGSIRVAEINSQSSDSLMYSEYRDSGWTVIAVGGFSLSRGLTLEGLSVSYVLRRSMMYDTLFQMGRWFGYRDEYRELCRVWMPDEARGWYEHIAASIEELREELVQMEIAKATPQEFGLKVRSHPDWLMVTARNKMGTGVTHRVKIGLANRFVETTVLHRDPPSLEANIRAVEELVAAMTSSGVGPQHGFNVSEGRLVRNVPIEIVDAFLVMFKNHPRSPLTQTDPVRRHISSRKPELATWDVLFAGIKKTTPGSLVYQLPGLRIICQRRKPGRGSNDGTVSFARKRRVASRGVERVGLSDSRRERAEAAWRAKQESDGRAGKDKRNYPDRIYRKVRERPLLIIHLLAIGSRDEDLSEEAPVVAWSISFPETSGPEETVEYVVNEIWFRDQFGEDD